MDVGLNTKNYYSRTDGVSLCVDCVANPSNRYATRCYAGVDRGTSNFVQTCSSYQSRRSAELPRKDTFRGGICA
jgi:hypothetical protein